MTILNLVSKQTQFLLLWTKLTDFINCNFFLQLESEKNGAFSSLTLIKNDLLKISNFSYLLRNLKLPFLMCHGLENDLLKVSNFFYLPRNLKLLKSETALHCKKQIFKVRTLLRLSKVFCYPSNSYYLKLVVNFLTKFNQQFSSIPKKIIT